MTPTGISLFSGAIDGIGIAMEMAGIRVTHAVEGDPWRAARLAERNPYVNVINRSIRDVEYLPYADVLFGGPPCQPWSSAGQRRGANDNRHLWPEMRRIAGIVRPRVIVVENVSGAASGGLIDEICDDMEADGYACWTAVFPAAIFGAPHERYRTWIVGHARRARSPQLHASAKSARPPYADRRLAAKRTRGLSQPGVGNHADRSTTFVRQFPGWPMGQGQAQHDYEPPRTTAEPAPDAKRWIEAIGNAVVWQQAYPLAAAIAEWLR